METEIKFSVNSVGELEGKLEDHSFQLGTPRTFESNTLYDTSARDLRQRHQILRIRKYGERWVLTHKCPPVDRAPEDRHKHRIELETQVEDGEALADIFLQLGYTVCFRYEKWRSEWSDGIGHCVIDETPIGIFAELEGPPDWIDSTAANLGVPPEHFLTSSYGRLFEEWKQKTGSKATDLTFEDVRS